MGSEMCIRDRLRNVCGLRPGQERAIPAIHFTVAACSKKDDKRAVICSWWYRVRQYAPAAPGEPTPNLVETMLKRQWAPNLVGTKVEGRHPAMFLGVDDTTNYEALTEADALDAATATTKADHQQARGQDLRKVPMLHHAAVDTLKTFAVLCRYLWSDHSPLTIGMAKVAFELERQQAYRQHGQRFMLQVGRRLFSQLTKITHDFFSHPPPPPEQPGQARDLPRLDFILTQIRDGLDFQAYLVLPWLASPAPPTDRWRALQDHVPYDRRRGYQGQGGGVPHGAPENNPS